MSEEKALIFEMSKPGRTAYSLPPSDVPSAEASERIPGGMLRETPAELPEVSELDLIRHYTELSRRNHGIDNGFYPLGSCTMKYNPKIHEDVARYPGFAQIHPYQGEETVQGALQLLYELQRDLAEITGMDRVTLQPAAGAQGEWTGLMMIKAYHEGRGENRRNKVIVPDSAHGTNPASATVAGFEAVTVKSDENGLVSVEDLKQVVGEDTAALMLTNPNTLGLFEKEIKEIAEIVHEAGGLLYYDGANANAILGKTRPGDMGFDVVHLNLHKTFTTPHGGGGPGSGPVGVKEVLVPFLPTPVVEKGEQGYYFSYDFPHSIGRVKGFHGNFGMLVRAYTYIRTMGPDGLRQVSEDAVLNANYLMKRLEPYFDVPFKQVCKHEFVLSGNRQKSQGVRTLDMAKRLLDFGIHPPTVYFPLIVEECMMIEPTETESKETLDHFIEVMIQIAKEAEENPEAVQEAPHHTPVKRLDEVTAARKPVLRWQKED
ncbi:aminomethyl-transferring glycine dehydrogenase subunit GcvPB [Kroppenstedtia eburnea]|uniref:Probable glycine dehydrogenase (decarboxylating) subunit 2 n=1 Tax=Kroppenstedtia eburnea TaxID=714067 RepID=A0A1N7IKH7_9BACL|nr:aminomethyl-transferring glycine dehydrogenase subunit GcvPB [Kroppenstedtia eburnea]EGK14480.1 glycine cleavage system P protein subunit 2 [Desmospora sp. 8437]QKI81893.1 glycine dehydrogenase subunit 2 [Kroppenstedtia eburnea]SIS37550.1 glycine dehydrogenase (decarboxylating) beta subunit [Kroppenstedtia eburnea]